MSAESLQSPGSYEPFLFDALMKEVSTLPVKTVGHTPRSVRTKLGEILATEFKNATHHGIWGFARLFMFAKAVLRCPPKGGKKNGMFLKLF